MNGSRFAFATVAAAALGASALAGAGCSGDDCAAGPGEAPAAGLSLTTSGGTVLYGRARSSPNNDCTPFQGREPTSLTVDMVQVDPATDTSLFLTLCIPEPDALSDGVVALGYETSDADILLIDAFAQNADGDLFRLDTGASGLDATAELSGYCEDGGAPEGYAIALAGSVPITSSRDDTMTDEIGTFGGGAIAVEAQ